MQELEFPLRYITIRGLAFGDPSKPLMLALHGWLDNAATFIPLSAYLKDYYIVAIDFAGHGKSDHRSKDAHYHLVDFVYDVHELVESQNWNDFILLGHSMGGIIGSMYTSCFPEKVSKYITIESLGPITKDSESSPKQLRESIESRLQGAASEGKHPSIKERVVRARAIAGGFSDACASLLVERNLQYIDGDLQFTTDRRLRTFSSLRMTESQVKAFLQAITCPTIVIIADNGYEMMKKNAELRLTWISNAKLVNSPGSHHPHLDNPAAVSVHILRFIHEN
ncbi:alpha/beta hydrolase [uncultured Paraglaciecola sp.]|uniref:alpha/beta fold hydrolase n=1 Tax=uncultured Paraglaciecola sp. TaxID=1765024 RepID=UPI0030D9AB94|tara:strand:+ start:9345 stop:10187 length:843 start_codon:yes stop_codon:yes gene_type:complete